MKLKQNENSVESDSCPTPGSDRSSAKKKEVIENMKVEEDQVNLSDLGNGPDKPTIKTIVKKQLLLNRGEKEPTPSQVTPKSTKSVSKKSPESTKKAVEEISEEEGEGEGEDDGASEYSEELNEDDYLNYRMQSDLFSYPDLTKHPNFKIKRYKDAIYRG